MSYNFHKTPYTNDRFVAGISVTQRGRIGLTKHFLAAHHLGRSIRAKLYWDAGQRVFAIRFTPASDPAAFPVTFTQRYGAFINAHRFFKQHGLDVTEAVGRYQYEVSTAEAVGIASDGDVFLLRLDHPRLPEVSDG